MHILALSLCFTSINFVFTVVFFFLFFFKEGWVRYIGSEVITMLKHVIMGGVIEASRE